MKKINNAINGGLSWVNKYPYTDNHEMNLDFLLIQYQDIVDNVNQIIDWVDKHEIDYEEAMRRLEKVESELDTFETQIRTEFDQLKAEQTRQLNQAIEAMEAEIQYEIIQFRNELDQKLAQFTADFLKLQADVTAEINRLKAEINSLIIELRNSQEANNRLIMNYVENRLDEFLNNFPELVDTPVYNPVRGGITSLQRAINDLYDFARFYGLTAAQYDALQLTAEEYDNYGLTAMEYDQLGYLLLGYPDENLYMISPFTGQDTKISEVVMDLAHFHMDVLTAEEYDNLELTAEEYDALLISAFDYDWQGKNILTA